jgi:predicted HTH domain antitoxin
MKRSDPAMVTKSIRLAPEEGRALKKISETEHVSEAALMKKFVLEGIARRRLEQAIAAYRQGEIDLSAAARHADTSVYHLLEELKARDITPEAANEKFLDGLRTLAEFFDGSEALGRTLEQLRRQA